MKTFDEAVDKVLARKLPAGVSEEPSDMTDACSRYEAMHMEIRAHPVVNHWCANGLLDQFAGLKSVPLMSLLRIAFSHGVMVGIEMEKQDA